MRNFRAPVWFQYFVDINDFNIGWAYDRKRNTLLTSWRLECVNNVWSGMMSSTQLWILIKIISAEVHSEHSAQNLEVIITIPLKQIGLGTTYYTYKPYVPPYSSTGLPRSHRGIWSPILYVCYIIFKCWLRICASNIIHPNNKIVMCITTIHVLAYLSTATEQNSWLSPFGKWTASQLCWFFE